MSCIKGRNVLNEVPDYEASKGEPGIVRALRRLRERVRRIEQVRQIENPSKSFKDIDTLDKEDLTLNDVQYELGMLQIQFVRSLLRKGSVRNLKERESSESRSNNFTDFISQVVIDDKETQTGHSLIETYSSDSPLFDLQSKDIKTSAGLKATASVQTVGEDVIDSMPERSKFTKSSSQPHYHLKLDDVPFILGASSSASHSVVANLQNIIAMMKSHNKCLCGPKPHVQQRSISNQSKGDTFDGMLKELTDGLSDLSKRQKKLKDIFDNAQQKGSFLQSKPTVADNHTLVNGKKHNCLKSQQKMTVPNVRSASSIPPLPARRKLLRSLQDFKTHLSEEDITWN